MVTAHEQSLNHPAIDGQKSETIFKRLHAWGYRILIFSIIVGALLLRLESFQGGHYLMNGDSNRDYLVAHHILAYKELPLTGPASRLSYHVNSPAYFYFLTLPLLLKDNYTFFNIFNIFLQMGALILVYLLARQLFGQSVGLATLALFAFNEKIIDQSNFAWQPHVMQPFLLLSFLLLAVAYTRKRYLLAALSVGCFTFAGTLHQSAFAVTPVYLIAIFLTLRTIGMHLRGYAGITTVFISSFALLHVPSLLYALRYHPDAFSGLSHETRELILPLTNINFEMPVKLFFSVFFAQRAYDNPLFFLPIPAILIVAAGLIFFYEGIRRNWTKKQCSYFLLFLGAIMQVLLISAFVQHFQIRYLTPLFGIGTISIAALIHFSLPRKPFAWTVGTLTILILIGASFPAMPKRIIAAWKTCLKSYSCVMLEYAPPYFVTPLIQEILSIREKERRPDFNFFEIQSYRYTDFYIYATYMVPLEYSLNTRLTVVDSDDPQSFRRLGSPEYFFFDCKDAENLARECLAPFLDQHPDFHVERNISTNPPIFIARRISTK